jgi:SAM-dependent methyltransferase
MLSIYWSSLKCLARTVRCSLGKFPRECPLCGHKGKFLGSGYPYVCDILCPSCGTLERHRLLSLANRDHDFFRGLDVLHFAPEKAIRKLVLKHRPRSYTTADPFAADGDTTENIELLKIEDASFDVILCLHVLEHVNDRKAVRELYRVLRPGGTLIAMFPIVEGWDETYENGAPRTPEQRLLHFGQHDHARFFGRDARSRLAGPGFVVEEYTAVEPNVSRYGLSRGEKVFICSRPAVEETAAMDHGAMAGNSREPEAALMARSARS